MFQPLVAKRDFAVELDRHPDGIGQHGSADVLDRRESGRRVWRRRWMCSFGEGDIELGEGRRHPAGQVTCRIFGRQGAQESYRGGLLVLVAKLPERIQRELSSVPESIVAETARG